ncbi:MAG: UDP-3-O-(3-hydroxymyristoyl)glucosamine N-acyltransferase [Gemmatimonadetes bacterium]|nr:UDP-3-O-(3-hydroxymyristoyl)glucosamine N-acyltransferase [Gemmatimonadota bacterium]MYB98603.1 UDP-3-O-(3-hydroxymyristoyl)glucosamine N-acyltransferase [Gemmatimonadota bacterium]MYI46832.1 UDP-3-O-(3-hydroxymyristoyl)glucosamine N-acyltransferase [Gemmatimonadota bacterium]
MTLAEAAAAAGGRVLGDGSLHFERIATVRDAGPRDLAMMADHRYAAELSGCRGGALLVPESLSGLEGGPADRLVVADPHAALIDLLPLLHPEPPRERGVHPAAVIDPSVTVPGDACVGPHAVIRAGAAIGAGARIGANCFVGEGVAIGKAAVLHPNVTLYAGSVLGDRVVIHAGARIGVDGFGYVSSGGVHRKVPQVGGCVIEDDVEIGANCTIDRGSIGRTVIGAGSKLDNLVHIGHNASIGPGSMLVAQVGVAGSVRSGAGVAMGGQAGISGHLRIGERARIAAQAGVIGDVEPGQTVSGYPARDHKSYLRSMAGLMKLPELIRRVGRVERRLGLEEAG